MELRNCFKKIKTTSLLLLATLSATCYAANAPHTWQTVISENGTWHARLQMINEGGNFVARDGSPLNEFVINTNYPKDFGFSYDIGDDFDVAYTLTLTQEAATKSQRFTSKACVYIVTASSPGKPDIRTSSFNGAQCNSSMTKGVESFIVS